MKDAVRLATIDNYQVSVILAFQRQYVVPQG